MKKPTLNAADVLNMEYLEGIADEHPGLAYTTDIKRALERFAFYVTEAADEDERNEILADLLDNATSGQSKEKNDETVKCFAELLRTDHLRLREFAKQEGIRLSARPD